MTHATYAVLTCGLALATASALTACSPPESQAASDAAASFQQAVAAQPARACEQLAPETLKRLEEDGACAQALPALKLPGGKAAVRDVQVAGHSARVRTDSDVLFLALFDDGWKVVAAGCESGEDLDTPADCELED